MKKTLIALMALAGVAMGDDYTMTKGGNLFAGAFTLEFTLEENFAVTDGYDILAAYYQVNTGADYTVNAFLLNSNNTLTLTRGKSLTLTDDTLTNASTITTNNTSTFTTDGTTNGTAYTLGAGTYTLKYLGGTNGSAAADLYLNGTKVASFTGGNHNMNGINQGGNDLYLKTNDSHGVTATIPEPTTATLSLLALAGLAARRRRK